jgi:hypothetical protein
MKIFHRKFLENAPQINNSLVPQEKVKPNYFINQLIIWILIFSIIFFMVQFLKWNTNFN